MKAAGCGYKERAILGELDKLAVSWHDGEYGGCLWLMSKFGPISGVVLTNCGLRCVRARHGGEAKV